MEYPTYPYDIETRNQPLNYSFIFLLNRIYRKQLYKYVDRIVTFTDLEKIHGIKTIRISNGVDFCTLPLKSKKEKSNTINLISVAEIHYWHGLDRVINGLSKYYDKDKPSSTEVNLTIVGGGDKRLIDSLIKLTINLKLQDHVRFVGYKSGEELDRLFEEADFGIASLARHRSGISKIKTLKNREYAARGLPFIYSEDDEDFDNMPYIIKAPPDESPIN
jgi:glycosyltransferase involved in cell wall biosynthesis